MKLRIKLLILLSVFTLVASVTIAPQAAQAFSGGDGTSSTPHQIANCNDLREVDDNPIYFDDYFVLTASFSCDDAPFVPLTFVLDFFSGDLDGAGFTIADLDISVDQNSTALFAGIFGARIHDINFDQAAVISNGDFLGILGGSVTDLSAENITVTNSSVTGTSVGGAYVGGLSANSANGVYNNISMDVVIDAVNYQSVGAMFGRSYQEQISDVLVSDSSTVLGDDEVGGLAGYSEASAIDTAQSSADVTGTDGSIGGLIGSYNVVDNHDGFITNAKAFGNVDGDRQVGGLVGRTGEYNTTGAFPIGITNSQATGNVTGNNDVGGFVGRNYSANISTSFATGDVTGVNSDPEDLGGFAGINGDEDFLVGNISQSYATGDVNGSAAFEAGGFVADINDGVVSDSYARGNVIGFENVGGFVGDVDLNGSAIRTYSTGTAVGDTSVGGHSGFNEGTIEDSYWDEETSGEITSAGGVGLDTNQAKTQSTYTSAGWDFADVWGITVGVNNGYPCLLTFEECGGVSLDEDSDGISTAIENAGPNSGDANGDGTQDSEQSNVASFVSPITGQYVVVSVSDDCELQSVSLNAESGNATADVAFDYPVGFTNFTAVCQGSETAVNVRFFNLEDASFVARKYNPNTKAYFTIDSAVKTQGTLAGLKLVNVAYTVVDNGPLDSNPATGTITDPIGLGQVVLGAPRTGGGGTFGK